MTKKKKERNKLIGAIIGDIAGSRFEFNNYRYKDFQFFHPDCMVTDDSIMTLALAKALMETDKAFPERKGDFYRELRKNAVQYMRKIGRDYPGCGYGGRFSSWMFNSDMGPYNSLGNGAAMRVSPAGFMARTEEEALLMADALTDVTHNHPEGIKGARATALCVFLAKKGKSQAEIRERIHQDYYPLTQTTDEIRPHYVFNETCRDTVPQAITAFLEATSFEDAIRTGISLGGDSDTIGAITGGMAEACFGIDEKLKQEALAYLDNTLLTIYQEWEATLGKQT